MKVVAWSAITFKTSGGVVLKSVAKVFKSGCIFCFFVLQPLLNASQDAQVKLVCHQDISWDKSPAKIERFTLMCPIHGNL